jgi:hypothetical protein
VSVAGNSAPRLEGAEKESMAFCARGSPAFVSDFPLSRCGADSTTVDRTPPELLEAL